MKHAKFVSFTLCGAQTVQKAVKLLPDFRCERYARTVDASLSGTSLKRFAQQAMVDCDLIVFVGATGIAVRAAASAGVRRGHLGESTQLCSPGAGTY